MEEKEFTRLAQSFFESLYDVFWKNDIAAVLYKEDTLLAEKLKARPVPLSAHDATEWLISDEGNFYRMDTDPESAMDTVTIYVSSEEECIRDLRENVWKDFLKDAGPEDARRILQKQLENWLEEYRTEYHDPIVKVMWIM